MEKVKISRVDVLALANDLARNATNDQLLIHQDYSELGFDYEEYCDEDDLFTEDDENVYKPEVQKLFNSWVAFYLNHIEACSEPEPAMPVKDNVFLLKDFTGHAIATVSASTDEILNAKFKEAVNEFLMVEVDNDLNIVPLSMDKIISGETHGVLVSVFKTCRSVYIELVKNY